MLAPLHDPPAQESNVCPTVGVAVSVTAVPVGKDAAQVLLVAPAVLVQLIPLGDDFTVPLPVPPPVTVSVSGGIVLGAKLATNVRFAVTGKVTWSFSSEK